MSRRLDVQKLIDYLHAEVEEAQREIVAFEKLGESEKAQFWIGRANGLGLLLTKIVLEELSTEGEESA